MAGELKSKNVLLIDADKDFRKLMQKKANSFGLNLKVVGEENGISTLELTPVLRLSYVLINSVILLRWYVVQMTHELRLERK